MKTIDVKSIFYAESNVDSKAKNPQLEIANHVTILKNIFAKGYTPNWSEKGLVISKIQDTVPWKTVIMDVNGAENIESFYKKEPQKTNQKEFSTNKQINKRKKSYILNIKAIMTHYIVGIIKRHCIKLVNTFLNHKEVLQEILISKLFCLIMHENWT